MAKRRGKLFWIVLGGFALLWFGQQFNSGDTSQVRNNFPTQPPRTVTTLPSTVPIPAPPINRDNQSADFERQQLQPPTQPFNLTAYVSTEVLNVRAGPSTEHSVLGQLGLGDEVFVLSRTNDWAQVRLAGQSFGWVSTQFLSANRPQQVQTLVAPTAPQQALLGPSRSEIVRQIMQDSLRSYSGSCPCPYNSDLAGRRCGARSAYSRPGGARPLCYESDVSEAMIARFLSR